jgi:hypothetical protein
VQDPIYIEIDKKIVQNLSITILEDPLGFLEVDDTTIVVCYLPNIPNVIHHPTAHRILSRLAMAEDINARPLQRLRHPVRMP